MTCLPNDIFRSWRDGAWARRMSSLLRVAIVALLISASAAGVPPTPDGAVPATAAATSATARDAARTPAVVTVGFTVRDMDASLRFFEDVLEFRKITDTELAGTAYEHLQGVFGARARVCVLRLGDERLELTQYLAPEGRAVPKDSRSNDRWFQHIAIITSDMDAAYERLRAHHVRHASSGPQRLPDWNANVAGISAFYFKDPDGHVLEVLSFPPDKGLAKWHTRAKSGALFLGIDHTAIVVRDTDASLAFYRDVLGMHVTGASENYGTEQEHLNNVFGARLRITSLRLPADADRPDGAGPAIELLEYLSPSGGRPFPADTRACDLWHWQTTIRAEAIDSLADEARRAGGAWISPGVVQCDDGRLGIEAGCLLRDPDGHAIRVVTMP